MGGTSSKCVGDPPDIPEKVSVYPFQLEACIEQKDPKNLEILLKRDVTFVNSCSSYGSPLHCALYFKSAECVRLLILYGAEMERVRSHGRTAFEIGQTMNDPEMMRAVALTYWKRLRVFFIGLRDPGFVGYGLPADILIVLTTKLY